MNAVMTRFLSGSGVPVLAYHRVLNMRDVRNGEIRSLYAMSQQQFAQQMTYLSEHDFRAVTLDEVFRDPASTHKRVVICFDDGYADNFTNALPVLNDLGLKATFFLIVNRMGSDEFMTWQQVERMQEQNMAMQSHTLNHPILTNLHKSELLKEVARSKSVLEKRLGVPVDYISFPHGMYSESVVEACRKAGYSGSCNSDFGYFNPAGDPFRINRIMVKRSFDFQHFVQMVQANWRFILKHGSSSRLKKGINQIIGFDRYQRLAKMLYRSEETIT